MTTPGVSRALDQIGRKLTRARRDLKDLKAELDTYDASGFEVVRGEEIVDGDVMFTLGDRAPLDPEWELTVGEIAYQVRSSLDQVIGAAVVANGGDLDRHRGGYPISQSELEYRGAPRRGGTTYRDRMLTGVAPAVREVVDASQPWRAEEPELHPLTQLNRLCNSDKHRATQAAVTVTRGQDLLVNLGPGVQAVWQNERPRSAPRVRLQQSGQRFGYMASIDVEQFERILLSFPHIDPTDVVPVFRFAVTFGDACVFTYELNEMIDFVESEVVARIAPLITGS